MEAKKTWYKSKITLLAISGAFVFGSNALMGWLTGSGVTPEQIESLQLAQPAVADAVERLQSGEQWLTVAGTLISLGVGVFRVWFTTKKIA